MQLEMGRADETCNHRSDEEVLWKLLNIFVLICYSLLAVEYEGTFYVCQLERLCYSIGFRSVEKFFL